ncbi:hypothetical protein, partial [uncultured Bacteroides sp.]|uniref:hypothetical protein n=1 Tax=uncultured Bacteroides sp. TaxID=162156 RepID=UPI0027D9B401
MKKVLIFPAPFLIKSPTADQQNEYMISMLKDKMAMEGIGDFIEVNALNKSYYCKEVRKIIADQKPDWVIASGESATACISLHGQKKILVNPVVTFDDLNNVSEYARLHTYGFFGALPQQQKSYEMFQTVYPNVAWYINAPNLILIGLSSLFYILSHRPCALFS